MLHTSAGKFSFILLSLFYIHFSLGQSIDPGMITQVIGSLTQVMGQSEAECGTEYKGIMPHNEDFCADLSSSLTFDFSCPAAVPKVDPPPTEKCWDSVTEFVDNTVDTAVNQTLKNGNAVCHCCMVPSICLLGGVGRIIDLLRVGNYAGLLMGLNNNKICAAIEKSQQVSAGLDLMSGGKCIIKGRKCRKTHTTCVEELEERSTGLITKIKDSVEGCNGRDTPYIHSITGQQIEQVYPQVDCSAEISQLEGYIPELESSSDQKCGAASRAGQSQLVQSALTGVASLISRECRKDYERDTKCDDKKDEELDQCCEKHPRADACERDPCAGQQGEELESCCSANSQSALCRGSRPNSFNACHPTQMMNDPQPCLEKCRENPTLPGCKNFCNLYWNKEVCAEVCKTYQMPKCEESANQDNACDSDSDQVCCEDAQSPECNQFCIDNPDSSYCQCANNSGRCRCDQPEDAPYISEGQCSTTDLTSLECEDPDDPACDVKSKNSKKVPGSDGNDRNTASTSPWPGPSPFADGGDDGPGGPSKSGSPTRFSPSGGTGGGTGGGGGMGGGMGGGSGSEGEAGADPEGGDDPYENILAGLSGDQNRSQGYGGGGGRGSRAGRGGSGFDLRKFLPKKKKNKKKNAKKSAGKIPSAEDNIFDISSQMMGRYCTNNNINCVRK